VGKMWLDAAAYWAIENAINDRLSKQASEVNTALDVIQVRPFYTAEELCMLFPDLAESVRWEKGANYRATPAGKLSKSLRDNQVRFLRSKDSEKGFMWRGKWRQYLVIADVEEWQQPIDQKHFETMMQRFPQYRDIRKKQA